MTATPARPAKSRRPSVRKPSLIRPSRLAVWQLDDRIVPAGTVTGTVFRDFNGNGVFDAAPRTVPNNSGIGDIGVAQDSGLPAAVTVRGFDAANQLAGATASTPTGTYTLNLTGTGPYRIEFSGLPAGYSFAPAGPTTTPVGGNGTAVQFVPDGPTADVNLGVVRPQDLTADNPLLATSQFVFGGIDQDNALQPVVQSFPYSSGAANLNPVTGDPDAQPYREPMSHAISVPHAQVGAVWGLAHNRQSDQLLMAAFMKRHSGFGPNGPGAIYAAQNPAAGQTTTTASLVVDLNAAVDLGGGGANPAGVTYRPSPTPTQDYFLTDGLAGNVGWNAVGNLGLGGLDVSPDGRFAYTVAPGNRRFYVIDLQTNAVRSYAIPVPALATGAGGSDLRPFAVTFHDGQVYVGAVNTAESVYANTPTDQIPASVPELRGFVFRFDPGASPVGTAAGGTGQFVDSNGLAVTAATASVFTFDLGYGRSWAHPGINRNTTADDLSANWRPWSATYRNVNPNLSPAAREAVYPQPWLTGLAFDADGNMVIGLRDRAGDQFGAFTPSDPSSPPQSGDPVDTAPGQVVPGRVTYTVGITAGDMLRATTTTGTTWTLENNGVAGGVTAAGAGNGQGPGGGEFYSGDYLVPSPGPQQEHTEVSAGGVLQLPGFPDAATTGFDPAQVANRFNTGGVRWHRNGGPNAGTMNKGYELYVANIPNYQFGQPIVPPPLFAKSNGIGDLVALNVARSLEIGNRVWRDGNDNGIQDSNEPGIAGLQVVLFSGGAAVATTTTAADGSYLFSDQPLPTVPVPGRAYAVPLQSGGSYQVRIPLGQSALTGLQLAQFQAPLPAGASNQIQFDQVQSDAQVTGTDAVIAVAALGAVGANHTYDAGFQLIPTLNLGDFVWDDANNNGLFDAGEAGLASVTVELLTPGGTTLTAVTNTSGAYLFTGLLPGQYRVQIPIGQTALAGRVSSSGTAGSLTGQYEPAAGDVANGPNNTDHGVLRGNVVQGPLVTLALGQSPLGETATPAGNYGLSDNGTVDANSDRTQDFGFYQALSLGDTLWVDANNDGLRQGTEAPLAGVTVQLLDGTGAVIGTATSNAAGGYLFRYLTPGAYTVRLVRDAALAGYTSSTPNEPPAANANPPANDVDAGTQTAGFITSPAVNLTLGGAPAAALATQPAGLPADPASDANKYRNVDFGLFPLLSLGDFVWQDTNNDGDLDPGEPGVPGVAVELLDGDLNPITSNGTPLTQTTGPNGEYLFTGLLAGVYRVRITPPAGFLSSTGTNGSPTGPFEPVPAGTPLANNTDNGSTLGDGRIATAAFNVTATNLNFDFGLFQPLSVGDTVWIDANNDGVRQPTEAPLAGVSVQLLDAAGATVGSTATNAAGGYLFTNLTPGNYTVRLVRDAALSGLVSSTPNEPPAVNGNPPTNDRDAGVEAAGFVTSPTLALTLGGAPAIDPATVPAGLPADAATAAGNKYRNVDFGLFQALRLGDFVFQDSNNNGVFDGGELPIGGVPVELLDGAGQPVLRNGTPLTGATDAQGFYLFTGLVAGTYIVRITPPAGLTSSTGTNGSVTGPFEPAPNSLTNNQDNGTAIAGDAARRIQTAAISVTSDNLNFDFGLYQPLSVGDLVFRDNDTNGAFGTGDVGIAGVTVRLRDASGAVVGTTTTGADGRYGFGNLTPGTYSVQIVPPAGLVNTVAAPNPQPANDQNRGIVQADGTIAAVAFSLNVIGSDNPDANGTANLRQDFGLTLPVVPPPPPPAASLAGTVYLDNNLNGVRDPGEQRLPDVRILLDGFTSGGVRVTREAFTDAQGTYLFSGLAAGTYVVREQTPTGTLYNSATNVGSAGGTAGTDITTGIVLPAGVNAVNYDFGEIQPVSLFGYVWQDVNSPTGGLATDFNGVRDAGEFPIGDTVVTVSGVAFAGSPFARPLTAADVRGGLSAVTGPNGRYDFPALPPGTYTLSETQPADYDDFREQNGDPYGPAPAIANDVYTGITLSPTAIRGPFNYGEGSAIDPDGPRRPVVDPTKREFLSSTSQRQLPQQEVDLTPSQINPGDSVPVQRLNLFANPLPVNRSGAIALTATGAGFGASPVVRVFDSSAGVERFRFLAYEQNFTGGVQTAVGDVNGDGVPDIVTAVALGGGPRVRVFSGLDSSVLQDFFAYESTFTGGLSVAVGDVDGDGLGDIITGTNIGGGPRVRVFAGGSGAVIQDYFAFAGDQRGGVRVAAADFNADGRDDVAATTGNGVPTRVRVFDAVTQTATLDFAPFEAAFTGGATLAAGDFDGDGTPDLIVGADFGGGPRVSVFSGRDAASIASFFAFEQTFTGGIRVSAVDVNGDNTADVVVGAGVGGGGRVSIFSGPGIDRVQDFFATDVDQSNGVYVGAGAATRKALPTNGPPVAASQLNRVGALAELPADFGTPVTT